MLIYNPAFDKYNCAYRILRILSTLTTKPYRIDTIRIVDFYVLFPHLFSDVRLPPKHLQLKKRLRNLKNNYNEILNPRNLFDRLANLQLPALKSMAAKGMINRDKFNEGLIIREFTTLPEKLDKLIDRDIHEQEICNQIIEVIGEMTMFGRDGLKSRTGLMEFKYDAI